MVIVYYRTIDVYLNNKNNLFLKDFFVVYKSSSKLNNFSYFLRSKLFLESLSFISAELPSLLKSVMKTFASVPAPRTSPVWVDIVYLCSEGKTMGTGNFRSFKKLYFSIGVMDICQIFSPNGLKNYQPTFWTIFHFIKCFISLVFFLITV